MALTETQAQSITNDWYLQPDGGAYDIVHTGHPLLWYLLKGERYKGGMITKDMLVQTIDGGYKVRLPIEYARANTFIIGNNTTIPADHVDFLNAALFTRGAVGTSIDISFSDRRTVRGPEAKVDLVESRVKSLHKSLATAIAMAIIFGKTDFAGFANGTTRSEFKLSNQTSDDAPDGLYGDLFNYAGGSAGATSVRFGNIQESVISDWSANVGTTSLSPNYAGLNGAVSAATISNLEMDSPNCAFLSHNAFDYYLESLQPQQRFNRFAELQKTGFIHLVHNGMVAVMWDDLLNTLMTYLSGSADSLAMVLNTDHLHLLTDTEWAMTDVTWREVSAQQRQNLLGDCIWSGAFACSNRKTQRMETAVSVS